MIGWLKKRFSSPAAAEAHFQSPAPSVEKQVDCSVQASVSTVHQQTQCDYMYTFEDVSKQFVQLVRRIYNVSVPDDFLKLSAQAFYHLKAQQRSNVLHNLAKGLGTVREDGSDCLFPIKRMPMGLLEHMASFFAATCGGKVISIQRIIICM